MLYKLSVQEARTDLPVVCLPAEGLHPVAEVGGERMYNLKPSLVNTGRQSGANTFTRACTTAWAID